MSLLRLGLGASSVMMLVCSSPCFCESVWSSTLQSEPWVSTREKTHFSKQGLGLEGDKEAPKSRSWSVKVTPEKRRKLAYPSMLLLKSGPTTFSSEASLATEALRGDSVRTKSPHAPSPLDPRGHQRLHHLTSSFEDSFKNWGTYPVTIVHATLTHTPGLVSLMNSRYRSQAGRED